MLVKPTVTPWAGRSVIHTQVAVLKPYLALRKIQISTRRLSVQANQLPIFKILEISHKYPNSTLPLRHWKIWQHWVHTPLQAWAWPVTACLQTCTNRHSEVTVTTPPASCWQSSTYPKYANMSSVLLFSYLKTTIYFSVYQCNTLENLNSCIRQSRHFLTDRSDSLLTRTHPHA